MLFKEPALQKNICHVRLWPTTGIFRPRRSDIQMHERVRPDFEAVKSSPTFGAATPGASSGTLQASCTVTGVPKGSTPASRAMSSFRMRMHPADTFLPMEAGSFVP